MSGLTKAELELHGDDWDLVRIALECLEPDPFDTELQHRVAVLYEKLQGLRLI